MNIVERGTVEHYTWGDGCDGWILSNDPQLTVIEERMPPESCEKPHRHTRSRQFFYVLSGELVMHTPSATCRLSLGQGVAVAPGLVHQARNESGEDVRFLVISSPTTRGDRVDEDNDT